MSSCLFCDLIAGKIPCNKVYEDADFFAFDDINPQAPVHILLIPKKHLSSLNDLADTDADLLGRLVVKGKNIAQDKNVSENGYRFVINCGDEGGQTVGHIHLHILGGRNLGWPPG